MAAIQYGSTSGKIKPKQDLFRDLGNSGINLLASPLEGITGKNFFNPEMTTGFGKGMNKGIDAFGNVVGAVAPMALNAVVPGAGTALSVVGKGIGSALPGENEIGSTIGMGLSPLGNNNKTLAGIDKSILGDKGMNFLKDVLKYGGKIHINPANKGKFNALKAKTGKSTEELTHSKNPLTKKRAVFAQNAAKWKHAVGGLMEALQTPQTTEYADGGIILPTYINIPENNEHAMGGDLTRYNGMKHEDGGLPISQTDEVEGGETSFKQGSDNPNDPGTFIFSDSILVPGTKKTFADESKKIDNKYKKREGDVWATNAKKIQLGKLAELQEQVKGTTEQQGMEMSPDGNVHKMGGKMNNPMMKANGTSRYNLSKQMMKMHKLGDPLSPNIFQGNLTDNILQGIMGEGYIPQENIAPNMLRTNPLESIQPKTATSIIPTIKPQQTSSIYKGSLSPDTTGNTPVPNKFNSDMTIPMAGYTAQALTNLPMLLSKPSKDSYDRITPEKIDLTGQRLESQGTRNKALAVARRNAAMLGSASAINSFTGATISDIYGKYGDQINNSLMNEKNINADIVNNTRYKNSQIQMAEVEANQREKDAVRSAKQQALFNIGQSAAAAGKAVGNAKQSDNMMQALASGDYSFDKSTGNYILKRKGYRCGGKLKKGGK